MQFNKRRRGDARPAPAGIESAFEFDPVVVTVFDIFMLQLW
jgi:hypothetical protein